MRGRPPSLLRCVASEARSGWSGASRGIVAVWTRKTQDGNLAKLVLIGRRCQKCGLVVSEESRRKEKIGGKSDASVAKALCPKCKAKFGNINLYGIAPPK